MSHRKPWSEDDLRSLEENRHKTARELSQLLGRTEASVVMQRSRKRANKRGAARQHAPAIELLYLNHVSVTEIARIVGISARKIALHIRKQDLARLRREKTERIARNIAKRKGYQ